MIFNTLFYMLQEEEMKGYDLIRVEIKEDEEFGEAIIQMPNRTPQNWRWNKIVDIWV